MTDLKRAERQAQFQADVLRQINDAVIAVDEDGRISYLNASAAVAFELDPDHVTGKPLRRVVQIN